MLLSVPLTMIIKIGLESSQEGKWFAVLLSGDDEVDASDQREKQNNNDADKQNA